MSRASNPYEKRGTSPAHPTGLYAGATSTDWTAPTGASATGFRCATAGTCTFTALDGSTWTPTLAAGEVISLAFTAVTFPNTGAAAIDIFRSQPQ